MLLVPGVIGPNMKANTYNSFTQFVNAMQEMKEDLSGNVSMIVNQKLKALKEDKDEPFAKFQIDVSEQIK